MISALKMTIGILTTIGLRLRKVEKELMRTIKRRIKKTLLLISIIKRIMRPLKENGVIIKFFRQTLQIQSRKMAKI